jgi:hypothetical protein
MSRESNDAFEAYAAREGYKPGTWNYIRAARAWQAAIVYAQSDPCTAPDCDCEPGIECQGRAAARGVQEALHQSPAPSDADGPCELSDERLYSIAQKHEGEHGTDMLGFARDIIRAVKEG